MRYGSLKYVRNERNNIGDTIQSIGISNHFKAIGIENEDIVEIDKDRLSDYKGEYVIVPIAGNFDYWYGSRMFPLPDRIIPFFWGFRCIDEGVIRYMEKYKSTTVIGCRDAATMMLLRRNGYEAFVSGCPSLQAMKKRTPSPSQDKVFLIDIPNELRPYIPPSIINKSIELSVWLDVADMSLEDAEKVEVVEAKKRLELLRDNAKLVITSKIHTTLPCVAMGIPVINVQTFSSLDNRYMGLSNIFDLYTPNEYDKINWNPTPKDVSEIVRLQQEVFKEQILYLTRKFENTCILSSFFEEGRAKSYYNGVSIGYLTHKQKRAFLDKKTYESNFLAYVFNKKLYEIDLVIYGAGDKGHWIMSRYKEDILMCKSCKYVDSDIKKQGTTLNGLQVYSPSILADMNLNTTIVIIAISHCYDQMAFEIATSLSDKHGMLEGEHYYHLDKLNATAQYPLSDFGLVKGWMSDKIWNR